MIASLESLCATRAVIEISNLSEVKKQIFSFSSISSLKTPDKYEEWKDSLMEIVKKILKNFNEILIHIFPCHLFPLIGFDIIKWAKMIESKFELDFEFVKDFISTKIFSSNGTIDDCKAARDLVNKNSLNLFLRFKIACYYFWEDVIRELWQKLRDDSINIEEECKKYKFDGSVTLWSQYLNAKRKLSTSDLKSNKLKSFYKDVISYAFSFTNDNLEFILFYLKSNKFSRFRKAEKRDNLLCSYFNRMPGIFKESDNFSLDMLISNDFKNYYNFFTFLLTRVDVKVILTEKVAFNFLKGLLLWPFQDLFIKFARWFVDYIDRERCYLLLHTIIDLIDNEYLGESYNYRLLLRKFWNISSLSGNTDYFLDIEAGIDFISTSSSNIRNYLDRKIVTKFLMLNKFTDDDKKNFLLIFEDANACQKEGIVNLYFNKDGIRNRIPIRNLKLLNMFIENVCLSDSDRRKCKEKIALHQIEEVVINKKNLDLADQIVNWATDQEGIENLKANSFSDNIISSVVNSYIEGKFSHTYFVEVLKWFLLSEDKILAWKKELVFDGVFCEFVFGFGHNDFEKFERLEMLLNWLFHPCDNVMNIKPQVLSKAFPLICIKLFSKDLKFTTSERKNILYLCSDSTELLAKFIKDLNEFCIRNCEEEGCCLVCKRNEPMYYSPEQAKLNCVFHGRFGDPSKETRDALLSSFSEELLCLLKQKDGMD